VVVVVADGIVQVPPLTRGPLQPDGRPRQVVVVRQGGVELGRIGGALLVVEPAVLVGKAVRWGCGFWCVFFGGFFWGGGGGRE